MVDVVVDVVVMVEVVVTVAFMEGCTVDKAAAGKHELVKTFPAKLACPI
jgi:hypothetical protein